MVALQVRQDRSDVDYDSIESMDIELVQVPPQSLAQFLQRGVNETGEEIGILEII